MGSLRDWGTSFRVSLTGAYTQIISISCSYKTFRRWTPQELSWVAAMAPVYNIYIDVYSIYIFFVTRVIDKLEGLRWIQNQQSWNMVMNHLLGGSWKTSNGCKLSYGQQGATIRLMDTILHWFWWLKLETFLGICGRFSWTGNRYSHPLIHTHI